MSTDFFHKECIKKIVPSSRNFQFLGWSKKLSQSELMDTESYVINLFSGLVIHFPCNKLTLTELSMADIVVKLNFEDFGPIHQCFFCYWCIGSECAKIKWKTLSCGVITRACIKRPDKSSILNYFEFPDSRSPNYMLVQKS